MSISTKYRVILLTIFILVLCISSNLRAEPWTNNTIGLPMRVLKPWTPLTCDTNNKSVSAWGRTYKWDNSSILPSSIKSGGVELLQSPMNLMLTIGGVDQALPLSTFQFQTTTDPRIGISATGVRGNLTVNATFTIDFDGFLWIRLAFTDSSGSVTISAARIDTIMPKDNIKYWQTRNETGFGSVVQNTDIPFFWIDGIGGVYRNFYHWFGNEERGLGFTYSSMQYWAYNNEFATILPRSYGDTYRMKLRESSTAANGLIYEFGIQATPIKALPPGYHSMLADNYRAGNDRTWYKLGNYIDFVDIMPQYQNNGGLGDIFPGLHDPENVEDCLGTGIDYAHDKNIAVGPAYMPVKVSETIPDINTYLDDWKAIPEQYMMWPDTNGIKCHDICLGSEDYANYQIYQWRERIREFGPDMIYHDGFAGIWPCKNSTHNCGYIDGGGTRREVVPVIEARTAMMRYATMLEDEIDSNYIPVTDAIYDANFPRYHLMVHSWQSVPPMMGFGTCWLTGEYLWSDIFDNNDVSYQQVLGLDKLRARSISQNWGVPNFWDAIVFDQLPGHPLTKMVFAWMLPHGNPLFYIDFLDQKLTLDVYDVMRDFGTRRAEFTPAFRTNSFIEVNSPSSDPNILLATWQRENRDNEILVVLSNVNTSSQNITLHWKKPYQPIIKDALTNQLISYKHSDQTLSVTIANEDFKLLWITASPNFLATFNNSFNADFAVGSGTATVNHNAGYPDVAVDVNGSGAFAEARYNASLHHPKGGTQTDSVNSNEYVSYSGTNNFKWNEGTYTAWVKPNSNERTFVPAQGFIICEGSHWSYSNSLVLYDEYDYSYNRQFTLNGTDSNNKQSYYVSSAISGGHFDEWTFVAATWKLVADSNSSTGYRLDTRMMVRPQNASVFTTSTGSTLDVSSTFNIGNIYIGSDAWGNRGYGGNIDWIQIYACALTSNEIDDLFNSTVENHIPGSPLFEASFNNNGFDADYAIGSKIATVYHNGNYPDVEISNNGAGAFSNSTPYNLSLHHPKGGGLTDQVSSGEDVSYSGTDNFKWNEGTYAAWVKPNSSERTFVPAQGFIICEGSHWSYSNSLVLYDEYDYSYNRQFTLNGTDSNNKQSYYVSSTISGGYFDEWTFVAATWKLVADSNSSTGYRLDTKMMVRPQNASVFTTSTGSTLDVSSTFNIGNIYIGSDAWGNRGYGGNIDWVKIYGYPLNNSEITHLYNCLRESLPPSPEVFEATFNYGFDADYAIGSTKATVHHDSNYPDIVIGNDGSGKFSTSSPNNKALYHPKGGGLTDQVETNEYVSYSDNSNFNWTSGSYVAWVKVDDTKRTYTPAEGFIVCKGQHYTYPDSLVLYDTLYYNNNRDFVLVSKDTTGKLSYYANALLSGTHYNEWIFVAATWKFVADDNSTTGYRVDAKVLVRPDGAASFTTGISSTLDVNSAPNIGNIYVGSDGKGNRGYGGNIEWVRIYDYELSYDDITSLYSTNELPTAPSQASSPSPATNATDVSIMPTLSWTAGSCTTSHNVYFGTDSTPDETEYIGYQAGTTYAPSTLSANTTYYWRIDEVGAGSTTTGVVWSFTTETPPTFVSAGSITSGTGTITPALPASITTGDILLLFIETSNQTVSISNQNGGTWTQVTNSPQYAGTAAGTTGARLTAFWSRYNGTQGNPTVSDSGDHQMGRIIAIRGAVSSGNPWDITAGGVEAASDTSGSILGATTTATNTLVVIAIAAALPDATGTTNFSSWTNANLASLTEQIDNTVTAGNGGGIGIATGIKATAGAYGNTTVTLGSSAYKGMMSIAIKP